MKRKMLLNVFVILLVAAVIGGATMAWFFDTAESEAVEFQAGTLLIDIDSSDFFELEGLDRLNPGNDFEWEVTVCNEGTKNLIYNLVICWDDILGNTLHDFGDREGFGTDPLSNAIVFTITKDDVVLTSGTLENKGSPLDYDLELPLAPGECETFTIHADFPSTSGNEYQGSKMRAAFAALAKQVHEDAEFPEFVCPLCPPFPSTNYLNSISMAPLREGQGAPHVNFVSNTNDSVTLEFVNLAPGLAHFEYRVDGEVKTTGTAHPNPRPWICDGEVIYSGYPVDSGNTRTETSSADSKVEVRLALGGERDWDFDWTAFFVQQ